MRRRGFLFGVAGLAIAVFAVAAAFYVNEARKEIVYLCGNFSAGVERAGVIRQLDTGHFLRYRSQPTERGGRLVADSAYTLGLLRCVVEFDDRSRVSEAVLE